MTWKYSLRLLAFAFVVRGRHALASDPAEAVPKVTVPKGRMDEHSGQGRKSVLRKDKDEGMKARPVAARVRPYTGAAAVPGGVVRAEDLRRRRAPLRAAAYRDRDC